MNDIIEKKNSKAKQNHDKSGWKAKRKELRRLEAIARQVDRIERAERNATKAKNKDEAQRKVDHAKLTLLQIRGGKPHIEMARHLNTVNPHPETK